MIAALTYSPTGQVSQHLHSHFVFLSHSDILALPHSTDRQPLWPCGVRRGGLSGVISRVGCQPSLARPDTCTQSFHAPAQQSRSRLACGVRLASRCFKVVSAANETPSSHLAAHSRSPSRCLVLPQQRRPSNNKHSLSLCVPVPADPSPVTVTASLPLVGCWVAVACSAPAPGQSRLFIAPAQNFANQKNRAHQGNSPLTYLHSATPPSLSLIAPGARAPPDKVKRASNIPWIGITSSNTPRRAPSAVPTAWLPSSATPMPNPPRDSTA